MSHLAPIIERRALVVLACTCTALLPIEAHAGLLTQVAELLAANITPNDESMAMLRNVVGDFVLDPFGQGGGTTGGGSSGTVLGEMFKTFNMFIFVTAMIWFTYTCMGGLAQTMHEGVVLGQRMSTVWLPIRVAFGAASLMPVFGGWAFCQALMVIGATMGIAGSNAISKTAIESSAAFQVTVNPMGSVKQAAQLHDVEGHILLGAACTRAQNALNNESIFYDVGNQPRTDYAATITSNATTIVMAFPNNQGDSGCGKIKLTFSPRSNTPTMSDMTGSTFGFRISGINYEGLRNVSMESHRKTLKTVYDLGNKVIDGALSTEPNSTEIQKAIAVLNQGYFGSYTQTFQNQLATMTASANGASNMLAINDQLLNTMKDGGWATLGIWYGVFAEVNEAMNEMLDPVATFDNPKIALTSVDESVQAAISGLISSAQSQSPSDALESATGNTSLGQYILGGTMSALGGSSATGMSKTINPIIAYKNIGDNALALAQTLYFGYQAMKAIPGASAIATAAEKISSMASNSSGVMKVVSSIATDAGGLLVPVALILFATAAAMAFYLPMLPFIQWFAALVQWFTSVLESLVGASLWALAHFDSDGDGMGQRTSYGYLYLFNNFARPIILTLAFFFASGTVTVLGTFLFKYFGYAVASAQGNSLTGLMSIVAYLVILTLLGMSLINSSFSLLLSMPDRLIGWIGQNAGSHIGQDVESRVNNVFLGAARGGSQLMGSTQSESLMSAVKNSSKPQ